jgi:hypothetical protein
MPDAGMFIQEGGFPTRGPCIDPDCPGHFDYKGDSPDGQVYFCDTCKKLIHWNGEQGQVAHA